MPSISIHTDDFVPRMLSSAILDDIEEFCISSKTPDQIQVYLTGLGYSVTWAQFKQFISDIVAKGELTTLVLEGDEWPTATVRPVSVSDLGINADNVWFGSYGGVAWGAGHNTGTFRFYVNGVLKAVLTDYYITSRASIGAGQGDTIQICQVSGGVVGWWASINVP